MNKENMPKNEKSVDNAAADKSNLLDKQVIFVNEDIDNSIQIHEGISKIVAERLDEHGEYIQTLDNNRIFFGTLRHRIETLEPSEKGYVFAWLQKFIAIMESKNFTINKDQQTFISNLRKLIGIKDEFIQIENIELLTNFGNRNIHEIIYSIYLVLCYLFNCSFDELSKFSDIDDLFKLSISDKKRIFTLVNKYIQDLGTDEIISIYSSLKSVDSFSVTSALSRVISITNHPLVKANISIDIKETYIRGFALLAQKSKPFNDIQRNYIRSLATFFKCKECVDEVDYLCLNQKMIDIKKWIDIFDSDMKLYSWVLDATYIIFLDENLCDLNDKNNFLIDITKIFKKVNMSEFIESALQLCSSKEPNDLFQVIKKIYKFSEGWKHIIEYRNIYLKNVFTNIRSELKIKYRDILKLSYAGISLLINFSAMHHLNFSESYDNAIRKYKTLGKVAGLKKSGHNKLAKLKYIYHSYTEKIISRVDSTQTELKMSSDLKKLKEYKEKVILIIDSTKDIIVRANSILEVFSYDTYDTNICLSDLNFDLDNSVSNNNWSEDFIFLVNFLTNALEKVRGYCDDLDKQLELFEQGEYNKTIFEIKKTKEEESKKIKQQERESMRSITVDLDSIKTKINIDWEQISDIPFDVNDIKEIVSDGSTFLLACTSGLYSFKDKIWEKIDFNTDEYFSKIIYINGYWIILYDNKYCFSQTLRHWKTIDLSNYNFYIKNILFYNDEWILFTNSHERYKYIEKEIIFNSTKTDSYFKPKFYRSHSLDGEWEVWKSASSLREGIIIEEICVYDGKLIAAFDYDYIYKKNKINVSAKPYLAYFKGDSHWTNADVSIPITKNISFIDSCKFTFFNNYIIAITFNNIFVSTNGYEWSNIFVDDFSLCYHSCALLIDNFLIIFPYIREYFYITHDAINYNKILLIDSGYFENICSSKNQLLAIHKKSKHEVFLMIGTINKQSS